MQNPTFNSQAKQEHEPNEQQAYDVEDSAQYYNGTDDYDYYGTMYETNEEKPILQLSSQHTEHQIEDLIIQIFDYIQNIQEKTKLHFDMLLYCYYGLKWRKEYFEEFIQQDLTNYSFEVKQYQQQRYTSCRRCFLEVKLISNRCGHKLCLSCWQKFYFRCRDDLFPKCPFCQEKMTYSLCKKLISQSEEKDNMFKKQLCKSYFLDKPNLIFCIGRSNKICTKYFQLKDKSKIIECTHCYSMICPSCGQQAHGLINCQDIYLWKEQQETVFLYKRKKQQKVKSSIKEISENIESVSEAKMNLNGTIENLLNNHRFHRSQLTFVDELINFTQKALTIIWGEFIHLYFNQNSERQFLLFEIKTHILLIIQFLEVLPQPQLQLFVSHKIFAWKKVSLPESQDVSSEQIKQDDFIDSFIELSKNLKQISKSLNEQIQNLLTKTD